MDGQKVVKVFSHEEKNVEAFTQLNEELYQAASKANGLGNLMGPINMNLGNFGYVVVAIGGACMAIAGFGGLTLDCSAGLLSCGTESVRLSGREFQVMELLMRSPRQLFSADKIMERVWGWDSDAEISVVWVHISNLRKKMKAIGSSASVRAVRGMGYLLEDET